MLDALLDALLTPVGPRNNRCGGASSSIWTSGPLPVPNVARAAGVLGRWVLVGGGGPAFPCCLIFLRSNHPMALPRDVTHADQATKGKRLPQTGVLGGLLRRPEMGAAAGAVAL